MEDRHKLVRKSHDAVPRPQQARISGEQLMVAVDLEVDASGLPCPLPLLKAKQGLNQLESGQCLRLTATDPGSVRDFHSFANLSAHELVEFRESEGSFIYLLRKA